MFDLKHVMSFFSLFVLIGVSISQLSILDHLTCAIVSQDLCMGLLWWFPCGAYACVCFMCGCVQGSSCMMDEAGTFLVMYFQFCCSVVENEKQPPASTGTTYTPSATSTFSQSASWMDTDGASLPCISVYFCVSTTCVVPGIALTWFCDSSQILHDVRHFYQTVRHLCFQLSLCMCFVKLQ